MSKKRKKAHPVQAVKPKSDVVWRQSAEEATLASKPRYNGFACGHGAHGPAKYSRARAKQAWKRQMRQEGASRGSFFFGARARRGRPRCRPLPKKWGGSAAGLAPGSVSAYNESITHCGEHGLKHLVVVAPTAARPR